MPPRPLLLLLTAAVAVATLTACTGSSSRTPARSASSGPAPAPALGACRSLSPEDVAEPSDQSPTVACTEPHTAETFAVGPLPASLAEVAYDDEALGRFAYRTCTAAFGTFLGADESQTMRTVVSWAWFRPTQAEWEAGARWYRCDVVGGGDQSASYVDLPTSARGLLRRSPDRWMVCVDGTSVDEAKIPCSQPHTWRAVTTIVLGGREAAYPGDAAVEARSRDYCSRSVGAWLGYPLDYDYGYTFFHAGEWSAGNRRSVCWARTTA